MVKIECPNCRCETNIYSTKEAAEYLGLSMPALKYHIYKGHITPQLMGHSLVFTKRQLDDPRFRKHLRG